MIDSLATILEIFVSSITILGAIVLIYKKFIKMPIRRFLDKIEDIKTKTESTHKSINDNIMPFIESFHNEFTTNSGKSLKDKIIRIDNAIKREELRSKLIADNLSSIGAYECNEKGEWIWVNKALCDMFGLSNEQMIGQGWLRAVCEEDRNDIWTTWLDTIRLNIPYEVTYNICNLKTNQTFTCRSTAIVHRDGSGNVVGYYGILVKI
jgi:PAS domain S-box-containing protein